MIPHRLEMLAGTETIGVDGPARLTHGWSEAQVHVTGILAGDVVRIWGSPDKGVFAVPGGYTQLGSDITANGPVDVSPVPRWIKVEREAVAGGGTVRAVLIGTEYT